MDEGTVRIELRRKNGPSLWAVIDAEDWPRVSRYRWHAMVCEHITYASTTFRVDGGYGSMRLHRLLLNAEPGVEVDHRDGDGLNNRRSNLRIADRSQNRANVVKARNAKSSRYKGVSRTKRPGWWQVSLANVYLGRYPSEEEAARVYDEAARAKYGEFACVNFPLDSSRPAA